jgi:hypothetical protein
MAESGEREDRGASKKGDHDTIDSEMQNDLCANASEHH